MTSTQTPQIQSVIAIARQAAAAIMEIYQQDFAVEQKFDRSPLTEADLAAHRIIVDGLRGITLDVPVLSEESSSIPFAERSDWQRYWLVDPLDGTKEFIKRNGEFTVNIALIQQHTPVLGVVCIPVTGRVYYGARALGAWRQDPDGDPVPVHVEPRHRHPVRVAGSRSHAGDSLRRYLENLGEHEIVSMGSSLKFCLVAEGQADVYPRLGPTSEWDTAAAQAVVEAAGGRVTDLEMRDLRYNTKDSLLNPHFLVFGDKSLDWSQYLP